MVMQNDSDNQYTYGVSCLFEKLDEKTGVWQPYPGLVDQYFPAIGYLLPARSTKNYTIPFIGTAKLTEPGRYRVWFLDYSYPCAFEVVG